MLEYAPGVEQEAQFRLSEDAVRHDPPEGQIIGIARVKGDSAITLGGGVVTDKHTCAYVIMERSADAVNN